MNYKSQRFAQLVLTALSLLIISVAHATDCSKVLTGFSLNQQAVVSPDVVNEFLNSFFDLEARYKTSRMTVTKRKLVYQHLKEVQKLFLELGIESKIVPDSGVFFGMMLEIQPGSSQLGHLARILNEKLRTRLVYEPEYFIRNENAGGYFRGSSEQGQSQVAFHPFYVLEANRNALVHELTHAKQFLRTVRGSSYKYQVSFLASRDLLPRTSDQSMYSRYFSAEEIIAFRLGYRAQFAFVNKNGADKLAERLAYSVSVSATDVEKMKFLFDDTANYFATLPAGNLLSLSGALRKKVYLFKLRGVWTAAFSIPHPNGPFILRIALGGSKAEAIEKLHAQPIAEHLRLLSKEADQTVQELLQIKSNLRDSI